MKLVAVKCPSCGANIDIDKDSGSAKCEFCHSKILMDDSNSKVKIEVSGNVEIKNFPKYENYVKLADRYYSEFMLKEARSEYRKALELNPDNIKLIFREKICRACMSNFSKTDENIVDSAFKEIQESIVDEKELSQYAVESCNAMAYLINKAVEYYQINNLNYSEVLDVHYRISLCAINIKYFKNYVNPSDKENMLKVIDYYISAMNLLTQDLKYKIPYSRTKKIYSIPYKDKREYINNKKQAENERKAVINGNNELENKSNLYIHKTNSFSVEKNIIYFICAFVLNLIVGIISIDFAYYGAVLFCVGNFIYQLKRINYIKDNSAFAKRTNVVSTVLIVISLMIIIGSIEAIPGYVNKWSNENINLKLEAKNAILKFNENDDIISGEYIENCNDDKSECTLNIAGHLFKYADNKLCYLNSDECSQYLEISKQEFNIKNNDKSVIENDCSVSDQQLSCGEKNYYVCSDGKEYKNYSCDYEKAKKDNENMEVFVSAIFAICLLSFIGWATNWRRW